MLPLLALILAAAQGAPPQAAPPDLIQQVLPEPGQNLKLWLPLDYRKDAAISLKFDRKPSALSNEAVSLRMALLKEKLPEHPAPPGEADLLRIDPSLTFVKFTGSVTTWNGRVVPSGRYEGFAKGQVGVYGRIIWLPLEPGTVVLDFYAEPVWMDAMNRDCDAVLGSLSGPIVEMTLREKAPKRWMAAKILASLGALVFLAGIIMIIARMNESLGGPVVYLGLFVPVVPLGYAFLRLRDCWRGLLVAVAGVGLFGLSIFLEL
jgi:hypothetical protein